MLIDGKNIEKVVSIKRVVIKCQSFKKPVICNCFLIIPKPFYAIINLENLLKIMFCDIIRVQMRGDTRWITYRKS